MQQIQLAMFFVANLRIFLWLFGAVLMRAFLKEARPAHNAARLGEENPSDRNWVLGAHAYRGPISRYRQLRLFMGTPSEVR